MGIGVMEDDAFEMRTVHEGRSVNETLQLGELATTQCEFSPPPGATDMEKAVLGMQYKFCVARWVCPLELQSSAKVLQQDDLSDEDFTAATEKISQCVMGFFQHYMGVMASIEKGIGNQVGGQ